MNIFVTGGTGFLGRNLIRSLDTGGNRILVLVRSASEVMRGRGITLVQGDVCRPESFSHQLAPCDLVFHCAGFVSFRVKDFEEAFRVNVKGTANVLEAAYRGGVRKVVHLSACAVLGTSRSPQVLIDENSGPIIGNNNVYAYTKSLAEKEVQRYVEKGLDVSIANIATVYGAGDRKLNSGSVIKSIYAREMKLVPPGGTSFTTVDDLVCGLQLLSERGRAGQRYIFSNENLSYVDLCGRIANVLGVRPPKTTIARSLYLPAYLAALILERTSRVAGNRAPLMSARLVKESFEYKYFDSRKARVELGWSPSQTLEEAVRKAFSFYCENHLVD